MVKVWKSAMVGQTVSYHMLGTKCLLKLYIYALGALLSDEFSVKVNGEVNCHVTLK